MTINILVVRLGWHLWEEIGGLWADLRVESVIDGLRTHVYLELVIKSQISCFCLCEICLCRWKWDTPTDSVISRMLIEQKRGTRSFDPKIFFLAIMVHFVFWIRLLRQRSKILVQTSSLHVLLECQSPHPFLWARGWLIMASRQLQYWTNRFVAFQIVVRVPRIKSCKWGFLELFIKRSWKGCGTSVCERCPQSYGNRSCLAAVENLKSCCDESTLGKFRWKLHARRRRPILLEVFVLSSLKADGRTQGKQYLTHHAPMKQDLCLHSQSNGPISPVMKLLVLRGRAVGNMLLGKKLTRNFVEERKTLCCSIWKANVCVPIMWSRCLMNSGSWSTANVQ